MCSFTVFIRAVSRGGIVSGFCFWSFYFCGYANSDWLVGFLFGVMAAMASRDKSWVKVRWHNVVDLPTCAEAIIELMPGFRLISTSCQLQSENPHTFLHCDQFGISSHSFRGLTFCVKKSLVQQHFTSLHKIWVEAASNQSAKKCFRETFPGVGFFQNPFSTSEKKAPVKSTAVCLGPNVATSVVPSLGPCFKVRELANGTSKRGQKKDIQNLAMEKKNHRCSMYGLFTYIWVV